MSIGNRIRIARKNAGLTQKELGERLGISYQTIAQWENNLRNPKLETLVKLSQAMGIPLSEIWGQDSDIVVDSTEYATFDETTHTVNINLGKYTESFYKKAMNIAFDKLNAEGQAVAMSRVEELTEIPKYKKDPPQD